MRKQRVELKANQLLLECGVSNPPVPLDRLAECLGATIQYEPFEGDDLSGMVFKHKGNIIIGINSNHSYNRQRFTIAHELGHVVLHKLDHVHVDKQFPVKMRDDISCRAIDPGEIEANAFAAALLMPEAMLKNDLADLGEIDCESDWAIQRLAKQYQVSTSAMSFRLVNLGLISQPA